MKKSCCVAGFHPHSLTHRQVCSRCEVTLVKMMDFSGFEYIVVTIPLACSSLHVQNVY